MAKSKRYYAAWDLNLDGENIAPGGAVELDPATAASLLKSGALLEQDPATIAQDAVDGTATITALEAKVSDLEKQLNVANNKLAQGNKAELVAKNADLEARNAAGQAENEKLVKAAEANGNRIAALQAELATAKQPPEN